MIKASLGDDLVNTILLTNFKINLGRFNDNCEFILYQDFGAIVREAIVIIIRVGDH